MSKANGVVVRFPKQTHKHIHRSRAAKEYEREKNTTQKQQKRQQENKHRNRNKMNKPTLHIIVLNFHFNNNKKNAAIYFCRGTQKGRAKPIRKKRRSRKKLQMEEFEKEEPKWNRETTALSGKETENSIRMKREKKQSSRQHIAITRIHSRIQMQTFQTFCFAKERRTRRETGESMFIVHRTKYR